MTAASGESRWVKSEDIVMRNVGGEMILVPIRANVGDLDSVYTLSAVAARVWTLLDGSRTLDAIAEQLATEYDVAADIARTDLAELMESLESSALVSRADG
jgi:hypothetical protein